MESTKKWGKKNKKDFSISKIKPEDEFNGYRVKHINTIESIDSIMVRLEHIATGAKHLHIANQDKENTFSVILRTTPSDSTGVAHILEHTVLCGSKKFNVRDPFFSMLKRSLSTFMNALTASDWTMYPFSSQNRKDYFNLLDVYLDAVFFPNLDELSFKQEGHRLEFINPDTDNDKLELEYKGVVYNEMKGVMSSPSQIMGRMLLRSLYPDTTYSNNSGGDPDQIPKLNHRDLVDFHSQYYHPSNSFFYTYGSFALDRTLEAIDKKVLRHFDKIDLDSTVPSQERWKEPRKDTYFYSFSEDQASEKKHQACLAWLTADVKDSFEILVLTVLEQILIGNAGSPLRKALIDSDLGSALCDATGFEPDNRDSMFACGLKDITLESVPDVEKLIIETLSNLVKSKIPEKLIESAIHQIEFNRKEITNTPHPFGIKLALLFAGTLIHEGDPVSCINIDKDLDRLKNEIEKGDFLEEKIKEYFLDNTHRLLFILSPDQELETKENKKRKKELKSILQKMSDRDIKKIKADAAALKKLQEEDEDVSCLPTLQIEDIPPDIEIITPDLDKNISFTTCYEKPTSGILYFTCPAGAGDIPADLFSMVPFFCKAFANSGTKNKHFAQIAETIDLYTGGISASPFSGSCFTDQGEPHCFIAFQGKALDRNIENLFDILDELIVNFCFSDLERIKQLLFQYRASLEASIVSNGHVYASAYASKNHSPASYINELWHGISQYQYIDALAKKIEQENNNNHILDHISKDLNRIAESIFKKNNIKPASAGSKSSIQIVENRINNIHETFKTQTKQSFSTPLIQNNDKALPFSGWYTNTKVSFVSQTFKTARMTHEDAPALAAISRLLRSLFLHREIREKGGAYGGFASYNLEEGIFSFGSFRDPHIRRTLDVYNKACDFIINGQFSKTDIKEAVLQVCSDIDKPETPGPASIKAFYRTISKLSDKMRLEFKKALLSIDKNTIVQAAQKYFSIDEKEKGTAIISSREMLENANKNLNSDEREIRIHKI